MLRRLLVVLVVMVLASCGGSSEKNTTAASATATPTPTATPWSYDLTSFQAHISEYLDPAWTSTKPDYPYLSGGYITGGLIVVFADTRRVISPLSQKDPYNQPPGPPDWGLPFARTPDEVGTVVIVWPEREELWTYSDGAKAYGEDWAVKVVDLEARAVVCTHWFSGGAVPKVKYSKGDLRADPPWSSLMGGLRLLTTR
jgi:hypothetical protein